jgi:hypothetical protein
MWAQLSTWIGKVRERLAGFWLASGPARVRARQALDDGVRAGLPIATAAWAVVLRSAVAVLEIAVALIVLFEEWGWRPLADALAALARYKLWARLELFIAGLPPYAALVALAVPTSIFFPLKLVAVFLLAKGQALAASALFVLAKVASTAFIARIFMLTKPALMRIGWFAWAYGWFAAWRDSIFAWIRASWVWRYGRAIKARVRATVRRAWERWRPFVLQRWAALRDRAREIWVALRPRIFTEFVRLRIAARRAWGRFSGPTRRDPQSAKSSRR